MSLTKVQKEILTILRDVPNTQIINPSYRAAYLEKDGTRIKTVTYPNFNAIEPYLKPTENERIRNYRFIFDPAAEISNEWPAKKREIENQRREAEKAVKQASVKAEADKAAAWFECDGPYTVDFSGEHFTGSGTIYAGDEFIANIRLIYQSSSDQTFEAMMKRPENLQHFLNIAEMLRRANKGA